WTPSAPPRPWNPTRASDRWLARVHDGPADPLWVLGAAATPPGQRACAEAALDACATPTLCPGRQDGAAPAPGAGAAPCGVWLPGGRQCRVGSPWLSDQHSLRGAPQPDHSPAYRCGRATGEHAV